MFFRYEAFVQRVDDFQVGAPEGLDLVVLEIEIRVGLADQVLDRRAVGVGHGSIRQRESPFTVFGKDKVRLDVDDLAEK